MRESDILLKLRHTFKAAAERTGKACFWYKIPDPPLVEKRDKFGRPVLGEDGKPVSFPASKRPFDVVVVAGGYAYALETKMMRRKKPWLVDEVFRQLAPHQLESLQLWERAGTPGARSMVAAYNEVEKAAYFYMMLDGKFYHCWALPREHEDFRVTDVVQRFFVHPVLTDQPPLNMRVLRRPVRKGGRR